jgi:hypothetical protein
MFILCAGKLPLVNECALSIIRCFPTYGSKKQQEGIKLFSEALLELWGKIFENKYMLSKYTIAYRMDNILRKYANKVQKFGNKRTLIKKFHDEYNYLFDILKIEYKKDMPSQQLCFYKDQCGSRIMVVEDALLNMDVSSKDVEIETMDISSDFDLMQYGNSHHETFSKNRSGIVRLNVDTAEASCQTESNYLDFPEIPLHVLSRCPQNVKNALAICSTEARISVEQSRIALKCFGNY